MTIGELRNQLRMFTDECRIYVADDEAVKAIEKVLYVPAAKGKMTEAVVWLEVKE